MLCVCTRGRGGGRRSPEILIIRGATAQTVRAAQRRLRGEIPRVVEVRVQAERVHGWVAVSFWRARTIQVRKSLLFYEKVHVNQQERVFFKLIVG